jgi:hypothetical protein
MPQRLTSLLSNGTRYRDHRKRSVYVEELDVGTQDPEVLEICSRELPSSVAALTRSAQGVVVDVTDQRQPELMPDLVES